MTTDAILWCPVSDKPMLRHWSPLNFRHQTWRHKSACVRGQIPWCLLGTTPNRRSSRWNPQTIEGHPRAPRALRCSAGPSHDVWKMRKRFMTKQTMLLDSRIQSVGLWYDMIQYDMWCVDLDWVPTCMTSKYAHVPICMVYYYTCMIFICTYTYIRHHKTKYLNHSHDIVDMKCSFVADIHICSCSVSILCRFTWLVHVSVAHTERRLQGVDWRSAVKQNHKPLLPDYLCIYTELYC